MFYDTDKNGYLQIRQWPRANSATEPDKYIRCRMKWNEDDMNRLIEEYEELYKALIEIGEIIGRGSFDPGNLSKAHKAVWDTYVRDFDIPGTDMDVMGDLILRAVLEMDDFNEEEDRIYEEYKKAAVSDAESRLENKLAAYQVIIRAKRLCKLRSLDAPIQVLLPEARYLAEALAINRYGESMEVL